MPRFLAIFLLAAFVVAGFPVSSRADDAAPTTESRLRDALRTAMLQLRDEQNQLATAQAAQIQSDKANADLKTKLDAATAQIASLTQQAASDKTASDKAIADLHTQISDQTGQIARYTAALAEWKAAYTKATQLATATEAARVKLAAQAVLLQRVVADRETKNLELYQTGEQILTRYEKYGLGEALTAKEPFTGITRVKLEELVQDYRDKLMDQRVESGGPVTTSESPAKPVAAPAGKGTITKN